MEHSEWESDPANRHSSVTGTSSTMPTLSCNPRQTDGQVRQQSQQQQYFDDRPQGGQAAVPSSSRYTAPLPSTYASVTTSSSSVRESGSRIAMETHEPQYGHQYAHGPMASIAAGPNWTFEGQTAAPPQPPSLKQYFPTAFSDRLAPADNSQAFGQSSIAFPYEASQDAWALWPQAPGPQQPATWSDHQANSVRSPTFDPRALTSNLAASGGSNSLQRSRTSQDQASARLEIAPPQQASEQYPLSRQRSPPFPPQQHQPQPMSQPIQQGLHFAPPPEPLPPWTAGQKAASILPLPPYPIPVQRIEASTWSKSLGNETNPVKAPATDWSSTSVPSKRRIAQSACETCRRKRTKCVTDRGQIGCNVCRSLRIPCLFSGVDKRKESVRVLRSRLAQLEDLVSKLQTCDETELKDILSKLRLGAGTSQAENPSKHPTAASTDVPSPRPFEVKGTEDPKLKDTLDESGDEETFKRSATATVDSKSRNNRSNESSNLSKGKNKQEDSCDSANTNAQESTLIELTDRLTVDASGAIRAESAASSLAFEPSQSLGSEHSTSEGDTTKSTSSRLSGHLEIILGPGVELPDGTSAETVEHLLNIYFLWELPLHPVISRPAFLKHMAAGHGPYFSSLLLNAILAFACTLSDRVVDPQTHQDDAHAAGENFFEMADDMLTEEIDGAVGPIRVPITTVQALILLVSRLLSAGNELKAWMLMGTCARMTLEMGLHLDAQAFLRGNSQSKLHSLTRNDLYVRAKTFWAVWTFEQEMCSIFGRTGILRDIVITSPFVESIDTDWSRLEETQWKHTAKDGLLAEWDLEFARCVPTSKGQLNPLWSMTRQIATIFAHSMRVVYYQIAMDPSRKPEHVQSALNKVMARTRELVKMLPPISALDGDSKSSAALSYHTHNRPFMTGSAREDNSTTNNKLALVSSSSGAAEDSPRSRCLKSAQSIVDLLQKWRSVMDDDLRTMCIAAAHILMSAGTIYLNEISSIMSTKATNHDDSSQSPKVGNSESQREKQHVDSYPPENDFQARRQYGKKQLREGIYPLLEAMGKYRPAPGQLLGRLKAAERERDNLVKRHRGRQAAQGNESEEPQADPSKTLEQPGEDEKDPTIFNQNSAHLHGSVSKFLPDMSGFTWQIPGPLDPNATVLDNLPLPLWDPAYVYSSPDGQPHASTSHNYEDIFMDFAM